MPWAGLLNIRIPVQVTLTRSCIKQTACRPSDLVVPEWKSEGNPTYLTLKWGAIGLQCCSEMIELTRERKILAEAEGFLSKTPSQTELVQRLQGQRSAWHHTGVPRCIIQLRIELPLWFPDAWCYWWGGVREQCFLQLLWSRENGCWQREACQGLWLQFPWDLKELTGETWLRKDLADVIAGYHGEKVLSLLWNRSGKLWKERVILLEEEQTFWITYRTATETLVQKNSGRVAVGLQEQCCIS